MAKCCAVFRLIIAGLYTLIGEAGFVTFIILRNYPSAVLGIITGAASGLLLYLHILNLTERLFNWYSNKELEQIGRFGFTVFCIGCVCLIYHSVTQFMLNKEILPVSNSSAIPMIWSFITLKAGATLLYYTFKYRQVDDDSDLLISTETVVEERVIEP